MKIGKIKFELVSSNSNQRFYRTDKVLTKFPNRGFDIVKEIKRSNERLKHGVEEIKIDGTIICISDAKMHIERLAFLGGLFMIDGQEIYSVKSMLQIDGVLTMMIHGGDISSVYDDHVYLRRIASASGFYYKKEV